jgi:competence protein ComEC
MLLTWLSVAWMAGIYLASRIELPLVLWGLVALLPLCVAWLWRRAPRVRLAALCGLFLCLGAARYVAALPRFDERSVATYNDRGWVTLTGVVAAEPDVRDTYINLRVHAETLAVGDGAPMDVEGTVLVRAPRYPEHFYGERVEVRGQLETPPVFDTFSYRDYLARQGIYSLLRWARVRVLARGQGNRLLGALLAFKRHAQGVIAGVLPEPCAALLTGILLGVETGLPRDLAADFSITGTSHIIAISGFNIAIISALFTSLSVRLVGRRYAAWFSTAAIAVYTLFVGASAAVVRAAVMGSIGVWGEHFGRQNSSSNALFATALLMTAWNPHTLWDLGFLLSFAATLGLVALADPLQRRFEGLLAVLLPPRWVEPVARFLNESLVLTTCAQLTTLPIIVYSFRTLSLVTLLSNVLILPAQQGVMLWGALATLGGLIWLPLGRALGWVAWLFLAYTIWVVEWTAELPRAAIELGAVSAAAVVAWYALLGAGAWGMALTGERRREVWQNVRRALGVRVGTKALVGALALVALLVWLAVLAAPDGKLHVTFLDVGQGNAVLVETPAGRQVVINGGPSGTTMSAHLGRRMPFWDRTLDLVALTDLGDEHAAGLVPVAKRYGVATLWQPSPADEVSSAYEELLATARDEQIGVQSPVAGTRADLGDGVVLTVLHSGGDGDRKGGVLVLRVDYGRTCFLLAGNADLDVERSLLARQEHVRCDVLQVGRHGGEGATSPRFLQAVRPALAVISSGEGNRSGNPDEAVLARLAEHGATVVRTDELGSVEVVSDGLGYRVRVGH